MSKGKVVCFYAYRKGTNMMKNNQAEAPKKKPVDIGGQAVMEGVMMKAPDAIAITVRRPNGTMVTKRKAYVSPAKKHKWMGFPFIRGVVSFVTMLSSGMSVLQESTDMLGVLDEEPTKFEKWLAEKTGKGIDKIVMAMAIVLAVVLSLGLFVFVPSLAESLMKKAGMAPWAYTLLSGLIKIAILLGYIILCSFVPDVRRTFQYHGAEHKTVYCHEHELPLTPENAQQFSTLHPRCGTAFLLIVFSISILLFLLLNITLLKNVTNFALRFLCHIAFLPLVAGVSYEVLKGLAHSESKIAKVLRWPGLQMQRLTTKQPTDEMLECAIVSMNVALYGLPKNCEKTSDGYTIIPDYRMADPDYVPEEAEPETAGADEAEDAE